MIRSTAVGRSLEWMRDEISPTPDDKARLRALIVAPAALLAPGLTEGEALPAPGTAPAPALTRWAALKTAGLLGVAAGSLLLGVGGGIGFWLGRGTSEPPAPVRVELNTPRVFEAPALPAAPAPVAPAALDDPALETKSAATPDINRAPKPVRARASRPAANPLNDELALLRRVERALRSSEPALAVALLGELDQRFPDSRLVEERLAARRIAECRLGEPGAMERAQTFLREHATSVYRQRVQLACAPEPDRAASPSNDDRELGR
jgi:hypothetical protein